MRSYRIVLYFLVVIVHHCPRKSRFLDHRIAALLFVESFATITRQPPRWTSPQQQCNSRFPSSYDVVGSCSMPSLSSSREFLSADNISSFEFLIQQPQSHLQQQERQQLQYNNCIIIIQQIRSSTSLQELKTILWPLDLPNLPDVAAAALRRTMELRSNPHDIIICISKALVRKIPMSIHALAGCLVSLSILYENDDMVAFEHYGPIQLLLFANIRTEEVKYLRASRLIQMMKIAQRFRPEVEEVYDWLCSRLGNGDVLATITAQNVAQLFGMLHPSRCNEKALIGILAKRIRKSSVKNEATITCLVQVMRLAYGMYQSIDDEDFNRKLRTLVISLATHVVGREDFRPTHVAIVFKCIGSLYERPPSQYTNAIDNMNWETVSAKHMALIFDALTDWRIKTLHRSMQRAGERLASMSPEDIAPWQANTVLRSVALLYYPDPHVMKPFESLATKLISNSEFLANSSIAELSNLAWFVAFKSRDQSPALQLGKCLLDPKLVTACTPKQASRIISAYGHIPMDFVDHELVWKLYEAYGVHLLSSNLNPAQLSSAIYGFAKVDYVHDFGVFDHLVSCMVQHVDVCTTRQCVQVLWACGKMFVWEQESEISTKPPYLSSAVAFATRIAKQADDLLPIEVSQSIWALGRLNIRDDGMTVPLLARARSLAETLLPIETANILWAMGKLNNTDFQTAFELSRRYATTIGFDVKPKEASTILHAFSRLNIRDEGVFNSLTDKILLQVGETSPQIIASVLRSHSMVQLSPPQQLLDHWAHTKLGLRGIVR